MTGAAHKILGLVKRIVRYVVHDYRINWVYASDDAHTALAIPADTVFGRLDESGLRRIAAAADPQFRKALGYDQKGARGYALSQAGEPLSVAHFVDAARYENATTWPLCADEVALVNIVTNATARGRGFAPILISNATPAILSTPFKRAVAFIWWNHRTSHGAFEQAGWRRIGFSIEVVGKKGGVRYLHLRMSGIWHRPRIGAAIDSGTADTGPIDGPLDAPVYAGVTDRT